MTTLLLRLQGPMQSWGTRSRFDVRDTNPEPSKSGVLGLVAAALGRDRNENIHDLAQLRFGVRVDREGRREVDYQTTQGVVSADQSRTTQLQTYRHYLADAVFLAGFEGDPALLERIQTALKNPRWGLSLGRRGYAPSRPIRLPDGLRPQDLRDALVTYPPLVTPTGKARLVLEADTGSARQDQPLAAFAQRRFGTRFVQSSFVTLEGAACS